ncbi:hypothetical protein EJB05_54511, partial [Eragrostis curvula]
MARSGSAAFVAVTGPARAVVAWLGLADVLCFLCDAPKALAHPADALAKPVSALLPKDGAGEVRRVDPRARCADGGRRGPRRALRARRRSGAELSCEVPSRAHARAATFYGGSASAAGGVDDEEVGDEEGSASVFGAGLGLGGGGPGMSSP